MRLTTDETRALGFVAGLLLLAGIARAGGGGEPVAAELPAADLGAIVDAAEGARAEAERRRAPLAEGERIDPNTATAGDLDRLPRVGAELARRIVEERERGGPFRDAADLTRVPGIGAAAVERLAPHLALPAGSRAGSQAGAGAAPAGGRGAASGSPPISVDPNRADAQALQRVPGIGPVLARRIVAFRDSAGPFRSIDELDRVPGIGPASLERLRPHLIIKP